MENGSGPARTATPRSDRPHRGASVANLPPFLSDRNCPVGAQYGADGPSAPPDQEAGLPDAPGNRHNTFFSTKRDVNDLTFRLGFVGRICPEKNAAFLVDLERDLAEHGFNNYRFLIVGDGSERAWLERNLPHADFTGELHGELLARAYANMDLFVFPSETDTYGNVVSEAMASGTPAIVSSKGGPKYQIQNGVTGFIAAGNRDFCAKVKWLMTNPEQHWRFREACRVWPAADRGTAFWTTCSKLRASLNWPPAESIAQERAAS